MLLGPIKDKWLNTLVNIRSNLENNIARAQLVKEMCPSHHRQINRAICNFGVAQENPDFVT